MANNVQSLDKKRKRGRPRNPHMATMAALWPDHTARSSLYNKLSYATLGVAAGKLGLVDSHHRDIATGKRMVTKLTEIARLFGDDFWLTADREVAPDGEKWLKSNWPTIVDLSAEEVKEWVREHNPRAKK